jgi:hypothetical protein
LRGKDLAFVPKPSQISSSVNFSVAFGGIVINNYLICYIEIGPEGGSLRIVIAVRLEGSRRDCNMIE